MCAATWVYRCICRIWVRAQGFQLLMLAEAGRTVAREQADYAWYTPAQPTSDHCAGLRMRR